MILNDKRPGQQLEDRLRHDRGKTRAGQLGSDENEFVPADTGKCVALMEFATDPSRHALQKRVADPVAQGVVDVLEAVKTHHQHGHALIGPRAVKRLIQAVMQKGAVWQAGQRIIVSQAVDLLYRGHPFGNVLHKRQDGDLAAVLEVYR